MRTRIEKNNAKKFLVRIQDHRCSQRRYLPRTDKNSGRAAAVIRLVSGAAPNSPRESQSQLLGGSDPRKAEMEGYPETAA